MGGKIIKGEKEKEMRQQDSEMAVHIIKITKSYNRSWDWESNSSPCAITLKNVEKKTQGGATE